MALDSRENRNSALTLLLPIYAPGIVPSSIDQAERQAAAFVYAGIEVGAGGGGGGPVVHPANKHDKVLLIARLLRFG